MKLFVSKFRTTTGEIGSLLGRAAKDESNEQASQVPTPTKLAEILKTREVGDEKH